MLRHLFSQSAPYCWAVLAVALAFGGRILLHPLLGDNRPFLTFFAAVAVVAWLGGRVPAIFATVLSYLIANVFLMSPLGALGFDYTSAEDWGNIITFFGLATIIVLPMLALRRAQRVAEDRTVQVVQLLAEANEANRRKEVFLATLSHELRNPLSPISNALQLWPHVSNDQDEMEQLRTVMSRQVKQLTRLLDDLMDISRISSGKISLRRSQTDLALAIAEAVETVQPLITAFGHELTVNIPDESLFINGDKSRLTQVFANILNNAAKYTPRKGVISVLVERQGANAVARIRDNGPGIPADLLPRVFDPFYQVDRTLDCSQGGLGIGLALVKQLVELHEGTVEARGNAPSNGSEFVVTFPTMVARPTNGDSSQRPRQPAALIRSRILVVDDFKESAETLAKVLRSIGQDATSLYDGESAMEWILAHQPDLVFLDIAMPGLDGYEVARRIRSRQELPATMLVALTGYGQREDRSRALAAGFNFHLTKPANLEDLKEMLLKLPARRTATATPAAP